MPLTSCSTPVVLASAQSPPSPAPQRAPVAVTLTGDALLVIGLVGWFLWDRLLRNKVVSHLSGSFAPIEEERKLNNILAQIGLITHASRVVLAAFHNGAIDNHGYHLTKLSTINSYTAPGRLPMTVPIRDLPVGRIMFELENLLAPESGDNWCVTEYSEDLPEPCKRHLTTNGIHRMWNRLIRVGNLPIGILSLQYASDERRKPPIREKEHIELLEDLYNQIAYIMRRRIISPGPIKRLLMRLHRTTTSDSRS